MNIEKTKEEVCNVNCLQLEKMYYLYLLMEEIEHSEVIFVQFLQEYEEHICPDHGNISYVDGKVKCSVHIRGADAVSEEDDDDKSVPFL